MQGLFLPILLECKITATGKNKTKEETKKRKQNEISVNCNTPKF